MYFPLLGRHKWGRSRYGILEVLWAARNAYDNQDEFEECSHEGPDNTKQVVEENRRRRKPKKCARMGVGRLLKPIRNRNLVYNPYSNNSESCLMTTSFANVNPSKSPDNRAHVDPATTVSASSGCLTKSSQQLRRNELYTIKELLNL